MIKFLLVTHVIAGFLSLGTGIVAMSTQKGKGTHSKFGMIYFIGMTYVFISAVILSSVKFIPFLFMISFLSYYACFSGVRILKLKKLHKDQKAKWYDWFAGILTGLAGISFFVYGIFKIGDPNPVLGYLSIFFGVFTVNSARQGLMPFIKRPTDKKMHWWIYHLEGMMGSYIAASTAFLVTIGRVTEFNHWILWVSPAIIGGILINVWKRRYRKQFATQMV